MSLGFIPSVRLAGLVLLGAGLCYAVLARNPADPEKLIQEADRLAWLKAWTKAEPLYTQADHLFTRRGDRRNALYAQISALRGQLPRLAVADVSQRLAEYLDDPLVQRDDRLRFRALVIKGDTDVDLDPMLAERSWREASELAEKLGESAWANRARGELGLVAFLQGDINTAVVNLGQALKVAESNGDTPSVVRWLTLFGHGYVELGRAEDALEFYDRALKRALKIAGTVPELQFPLMTYQGKAGALVKLGRFDAAGQLLDDALMRATREGALGYQAELLLKQGLIAYEQNKANRALDLLARATTFARRAGGGRILAEIALDLARIQRDSGQVDQADRTLREGTDVARAMAERILLPRLLGELADVRISQQRYEDAAGLLEEASELLEGLLTNASSPWTRSRVISGMDSVFEARIRLEGLHSQGPNRMFAVLEQVRGRSLLGLLLSTPLSDVAKSPELRTAERRIAVLQSRLLRARDRSERQRLLEEIFLAEEQLAPISTELFKRARTDPRAALTLEDVQAVLRGDEVLLEFALNEPHSYAVVATRSTARVHRLPGRQAIHDRLEPLLKHVREGGQPDADAKRVGGLLLSDMPEISTHKRLIVSADGDLHQLPFELLIDPSGQQLLRSHVVSYVPSGSVLTILRRRSPQPERPKMALAMSASPVARPRANASNATAFGTIARGVYEIVEALAQRAALMSLGGRRQNRFPSVRLQPLGHLSV